MPIRVLPTAMVLPVVESSQSGDVRRQAVQLSARLGFTDTQQGKLAIIATEMANNLIRHAQRGEILLQPVEVGGQTGVELVTTDHGPGIQDIDLAMVDGYSTGGTAGAGLGAIARLSDFFEIYTRPPTGTVVISRLFGNPPAPPAEPFRIGGLCVPVQGETECGDAAAWRQQGDLLTLMVVDGLGHGPIAAEAAREAVRVFRENVESPPSDFLQLAHAELKATRGAAISIAELDLAAGQVTFTGVGNVSGMIVGSGPGRNMVSTNGTVGAALRKIQSFTYPWTAGATLLMYSDGLTSQVRVESQPGLLMRDPSTIAAVLYRDFSRGRDDATIVVVQEPHGL